MIKPDNIEGSLVNIYLSNDLVFRGSIRFWEDDKISLINDKEDVRIDASYVIAISIYKTKENDFVKEKSTKDDVPEHKPGDVQSLLALREIKAKNDLDMIRAKLKNQEGTAKEAEYGNIISALRVAKNGGAK